MQWPAGSEGRAGTRPDRVRHPPRVLLVEDEPTIAVTLIDDLAAAGCEVTHTAEGREALALVAGEAFDAVITDLRLPGADGAEVLVAARRAGSGARLVVVTAWIAGRRADLQRAGADAIFEKPFANEQLLAWLHREGIGAGCG